MTKQDIIHAFFTKTGLDPKNVYQLFLYGSNQNLTDKQKDIDLLTVIISPVDYQTIVQDNYDIILINQEYFQVALQNFEPLVTEPLLHGQIILGKQTDYQKLLKSQKISPDNLLHLLYLTCKLHLWAEANFKNKEYQLCLQNLGYSLSYFLMAQSLKQNQQIISYQKMLANELFFEIISLLKRKSKNPDLIREKLDLSTKYLTSFR